MFKNCRKKMQIFIITFFSIRNLVKLFAAPSPLVKLVKNLVSKKIEIVSIHKQIVKIPVITIPKIKSDCIWVVFLYVIQFRLI